MLKNLWKYPNALQLGTPHCLVNIMYLGERKMLSSKTNNTNSISNMRLAIHSIDYHNLLFFVVFSRTRTRTRTRTTQLDFYNQNHLPGCLPRTEVISLNKSSSNLLPKRPVSQEEANHAQASHQNATLKFTYCTFMSSDKR